MKKCKAENCNNPVFGKGYCKIHQNMRPDFNSKSPVKRSTPKVNPSTTQKRSSLRTHENAFSANDIQKYKKYSIPKLRKIAEKHFNKFIRERDRDGGFFFCPTCKRTLRIQGNNYHACHLFPSGHYPALSFDEHNVWGGCMQCNYFKHGAGYNFSDWVREQIGEENYQNLLTKKAYFERVGWKWDRFYLISIIEKYK